MNALIKSLLLSAPVWVAVFSLVAMAQTSNVQSASDFSQPAAAARCPYTPGDGTCAGATNSTPATGSETLAQMPRRMPGPPFRIARPMTYPPGPYPGMGEHSGRHALIGAIIGGALGLAVASKGHAGGQATFALGAVGAGMGAAFGLSIQPFPSRYRYRHSWHEDEDLVSRSNPANHDSPPRTSTNRQPDSAPADPPATAAP